MRTDRDHRPVPLLSGSAEEGATTPLPAGAAAGLRARPLGARIPAPERMRLTVLVPAHNEETTLGQTLQSLWDQTRPPERIIVIADNCTDDTASIARANGAEVFPTVANTDKKAGGLNQCLTRILPDSDDLDCVFVMDADTVIVPEFIEIAMAHVESGYDAVGGLFFGEGGAGLLGELQGNEYVRYSRDIARHNGRVLVLTGTGTIFRAPLMAQIAAQRGTLFPGTPGQVYDTLSLTEDNEITLASKTLGASMISPSECRTITEVMPTWGDLWRQRMRWQRGALENITNYGVTRTTVRYWGQQLGLGYGTIALNSYLALMALSVLAWQVHVLWFWLAVSLIFVAERVVTVWRAGTRGRLVAGTIVIELGYDLFQQAVYVRSLYDLIRGSEASWNHVDRSATEYRPQRQSVRTTLTWAAVIAATPLIVMALHLAATVLLASVGGTVLTVFVACNTIAYAFLSVGKLLPHRLVAPPRRPLAVPAVEPRHDPVAELAPAGR